MGKKWHAPSPSRKNDSANSPAARERGSGYSVAQLPKRKDLKFEGGMYYFEWPRKDESEDQPVKLEIKRPGSSIWDAWEYKGTLLTPPIYLIPGEYQLRWVMQDGGKMLAVDNQAPTILKKLLENDNIKKFIPASVHSQIFGNRYPQADDLPDCLIKKPLVMLENMLPCNRFAVEVSMYTEVGIWENGRRVLTSSEKVKDEALRRARDPVVQLKAKRMAKTAAIAAIKFGLQQAGVSLDQIVPGIEDLLGINIPFSGPNSESEMNAETAAEELEAEGNDEAEAEAEAAEAEAEEMAELEEEQKLEEQIAAEQEAREDKSKKTSLLHGVVKDEPRYGPHRVNPKRPYPSPSVKTVVRFKWLHPIIPENFVPRMPEGVPPPPPLTGWLVKTGGSKSKFLKIASKKKRFFKLENGKLEYFEKEDCAVKKGDVYLGGTWVKKAADNAFEVGAIMGRKSAMPFEASSYDEREKWIKSISQHIEFANISVPKIAVCFWRGNGRKHIVQLKPHMTTVDIEKLRKEMATRGTPLNAEDSVIAPMAAEEFEAHAGPSSASPPLSPSWVGSASSPEGELAEDNLASSEYSSNRDMVLSEDAAVNSKFTGYEAHVRLFPGFWKFYYIVDGVPMYDVNKPIPAGASDCYRRIKIDAVRRILG